jgi:hypothetical protein
MGIRPIWEIDTPVTVSEAEPKLLLELEALITETLKNYHEIARVFEVAGDSDINAAKSLLSAANVDLVAGCEMARFGYLKQAYTLWRSWLEQVIFTLYFLEAPLHHNAWKIKDAVTLEDSPKYRLMLHQLLSDSGSEKHAFALVYTERYLLLIEKMKAGKPVKDQSLLKQATKVLTQLSQGVHGTFRPKLMKSSSEVCVQLGLYGTPALAAAWSVVSEFWLVFITISIAFTEEQIVSLRSGTLSAEQIKIFGLGNELLTLNTSFKNAFQSLN